MRPKGKRHDTVPVQLGGMFSAGAIADIPDGTVRTLRNYVIRPNRIDGRAPFVYDGINNTDVTNSVNGFAIWQDLVNEVTQTIAVGDLQALGHSQLRPKNTNGVSYAAGVSLSVDARLTSYTNFLGKLYMAFDNFAGVPSISAVFDGTNASTSPYNSTIVSRSVTAYNARLFLTDPRVTITPLNSLSDAYLSSGWGVGNGSLNTIVSSTTTVQRYIPGALGSLNFVEGVFSNFVAGSASNLPYVIRQDFRHWDQINPVPVACKVLILPSIGALQSIDTNAGSRNLAVTVGQVATAVATGELFGILATLCRCTQAGTTAGAAPSFAGGLGTTVNDGTAKWLLESSNLIANFETSLPPQANPVGSAQWVSRYFPFTVPWRTNTMQLYVFEIFSTTAMPAMLAQVPIDLSLKDGLADGDLRKQNYGFQITAGDFYYPFVNTESASTSTQNLDVVLWSEINNPKQIIAKNTYPLQEVAGLATAAVVTNGRLVVFKRKGMWIFKGVADINEPILPEISAMQVGCLGPLALGVSRDNVLYWIGENHVYKMNVGTESVPTEIDSPGMFEEIFNRSSATWVESQSTYNLPLLAIDHANKDVWIYTQKGKIYIYSIQTQMWSYLDTNPTGTAAEVQAMIFDPVSNRMLVSFGGNSATRFDETSDAADTIVAGGGTSWNIQNDIVPRPFELFAPRYEATLLELGLFHNATIEQGSLTLSYSLDRGATYTTPTGYPITHYLTNPRIRLPLAATNESVTIKLSRTGAGGARNWSLAGKADALLRVHRGEAPKVNAA